MASPRPDDFTEARWILSIALRNEGKLQEALRLVRDAQRSGMEAPRGEDVNFEEAVLSLEMGEPGVAVVIFERMRRIDTSAWAAGLQARHHAWRGTLLGMALAAVGDTQALLRMADTVEYWGRRSSFGRDRKAHHYLRGMALVAAGNDDAAVVEFRQAIHSLTLGFTRVNLELARALLRLRRPREAIAVLQSALRGDIDASNLYVTRTELHELLAKAFDLLAQRDSAAAHYRAVSRAWTRADPAYRSRRDSARAWLERNSQGARH
jgi:tetratricopeptide (TPR) repeat protein